MFMLKNEVDSKSGSFDCVQYAFLVSTRRVRERAACACVPEHFNIYEKECKLIR